MQPTSWSVTRETSLLAIDPAEWARVARGRGLYLSRPWLLAVEDDAENANAVSYLLVRRDGVLRAALPFYHRRRPSYDDFYDPIAQFRQPDQPESGWYPLVLGGTVAAYWNELLLDVTAPAEEQDRALRLLLNEFDHERAGGAAGFMFALPDTVRQVAGHWGARARRMFVGAQTTIDVAWNSIDDYVTALPKQRRADVRKELRQFARWEAAKSTYPLAKCHDQLIPLIANLQRKYGHEADESVIARQLADQAAHLDEHSTVLTCEIDGRIVAFTLLYEWENELFLRSAGFDYEAVGRDTAAYFNLACYEPLRYAMERGLDRLHLGMGTYRAKIARGARLTPCWSVVLPADEAPAEVDSALAGAERASLARWEARHEVGLDPAELEAALGSPWCADS